MSIKEMPCGLTGEKPSDSVMQFSGTDFWNRFQLAGKEHSVVLNARFLRCFRTICGLSLLRLLKAQDSDERTA